MNDTRSKLSSLRSLIEEKEIDSYIISSTDPHLGEYIPDHWRIIDWLTGFNGSYATVVITDLFAGLWTDSRYFIQAENQLLNTGYILMKPGKYGENDYIEWLSDNIKPCSKIALDGRIFSIFKMRKIEKSLEAKHVTIDIKCDLISELWTYRPQMPASVAFDHPTVFSGKPRAAKIAEVRELMKLMEVNYNLLCSIDDIMWLLNIRGNDVKYSPLLTSFAIIAEEQILLFTDEDKIPFELAKEFDTLNIVMLPYEEVSGILSTIPSGSTILVNPETTSVALYKSIPEGVTVLENLSIPTRLKSIKNKVEIENITRVMVKDGVALSKFFFWLENNSDLIELSELSIAEKLSTLRYEQENYLGPSFSTIVAYMGHGALPHYSATVETDSVIGSEGILLIDSGGQYLDGTTDITRTIAIGIPTSQQKKDFTLVLKGHISLAMAKFPAGTRGNQLDILARRALWENGLNYGHGTGHGVGYCLNVHEGPQNIGPGTGPGSKSIIEPGMLISDEPAIYREGEYGIRTENLLLCYEDEVSEFGQFLKFDTMSLCYIDKSLIDLSMLDRREKDWLNSYHTEVFEKLYPYLNSEEVKWLRDKTNIIP